LPLRKLEIANNTPFDPMDDEDVSPAAKTIEIECYETEEEVFLDE
jgi:hypothetical protein